MQQVYMAINFVLQVQKLKEKVKHLLNECSRKKKEILEEHIKELPPEQQHAGKVYVRQGRN